MPLILSALLLSLIPRLCFAQNPGQNLQVDVTILSATSVADTTGISYTVATKAGSVESLVRFSVDAPTGVLRILVPAPPAGWQGLGSNFVALTDFQGRAMAHWISADSFPAGSSTPELHFDAVGLPAIVTYWAGGGFDFPVAEEDSVPDTDPLQTKWSMAKRLESSPGLSTAPHMRWPFVCADSVSRVARRRRSG